MWNGSKLSSSLRRSIEFHCLTLLKGLRSISLVYLTMQIEDLTAMCGFILKEKYPASDHAHHIMQLALAANELLVANFNMEVARQLTSVELDPARRDNSCTQ
jgi:hypothetical protein